MKDTFHILFNLESERWPEAQQFLNAISRPDLAAGPKETFGYTFVFHSKDDLENFQSQAARFGFTDDYSVRRDRHYTVRDLSEAPMLWVTVTLEPVGYGGPTYGTQYDISEACSVCGSGARQISPLILKAEDLPAKERVAATYDGEILFPEKVAKRLIDSGFDDKALGPVLASAGNRPLPWRQLCALAELPPMSAETKGIIREGVCPNCGRDGYFHDAENPVEIRYDAKDVDLIALPPVVGTWERFGNSRLLTPIEESHFAPPLVIIKQQIYQMLRGTGLRGLAFHPVELRQGARHPSGATVMSPS